MFQQEITNLDIRDILEYDPDKGNISINNSRMVIYDANSLGLLRKDLINILGFERARGLMFRYGWNRGDHDAKMILSKYKHRSTRELMMAGTYMHQMHGISKVTVLQLHIDEDDDNAFIMETLNENSYECNEYLKYFKKAYHPVCDTAVGYASGYLSTILKKEIIVKEIKCKAMGDSYCQFVGKTVEEWGGEVDEDLAFLQESNLQSPLDEAYRRIEKQQHTLQSTLIINRKLMENLIRGGGLEEICGILSELLEVPVLVENENLFLLASAGLSKSLALEYSKSFNNMSRNSKNNPLLESLMGKLNTEGEAIRVHVPVDYDFSHSRVTSPVFLQNKLFGYISIISDDKEQFEKHRLCLERASWACSMHLYQEKTRLEVEQRAALKFLDEILSGKMHKEILIKQGRILGYKLYGSGYVLLLKQRQALDTMCEEMEKVIIKLGHHFDMREEKILITEKEGCIFLLVSENYLQQKQTNIRELAGKILTVLHKDKHTVPWRIGISQKYNDIAEIQRGLKEAKQALKQKGQKSVILYEDIGVFRFIPHDENSEELNLFVEEKLGNLLVYDQENNSQLTKTLYVYLSLECNMQQTAQKLNLSLSGFRYRLRRINELYKGDLSSVEERFQLYFAFKYLIMIDKLRVE